MATLNNKGHRKLNLRELNTLEYLQMGDSELEAYRKGFPHVNRYKEPTIVSQAAEFFQKPRIKFFLSRKLPTEKSLAERGPDGAPTKYRPRYVQKCYDYFSKPAVEMVQKEDEHTGEISIERVVNPLPTRAGFAVYIGVPKATIKGWVHKINDDGSLTFPEFSMAYKMGRDYIETILIENTLSGEYNPGFAKFVAQNLLDWSDKREVTTTDESKPTVNINVNMTKEEAAAVYLDMMKPRIDSK